MEFITKLFPPSGGAREETSKSRWGSMVKTSKDHQQEKRDSERIQRTKAALARWDILKAALLKQDISTEFSIHRFPGYQLVKREPLENMMKMRSSLRRVNVSMRGPLSLEEQVEIAILAIGCMPRSSEFSVKIEGYDSTKPFLEALQQLCSPSYEISRQEGATSSAWELNVNQYTDPKLAHYRCCRYPLDSHCSIVTREPKKTRVSLDDLVSHRKSGVDNTGNICIWDSERTLAYLLYNGMLEVSPTTRHILELGAGMAGMSGMALGLKLAQRDDLKDGKIHVTLTDGHADGVKNNRVNLALSRSWYSAKKTNPFEHLVLDAKLLLWTAKKEDPAVDLEPQDLCLVSDCTHFQNYHSALAVTIIRSLKVGGMAMLCQPHRKGSLSNFVDLVKSREGLVEVEWWSHSFLDEQHRKATEEYRDAYDEQIHRPYILILFKVRDLTEEDCEQLVEFQASRDAAKEQ